MDNKKIKYLLITIIALSVLVIGGTFSYFTSTVNTLNNGDISISTRDIGSIKYTGTFALNTTDFYPGSIGVTKFTIEKDTPTGTGYYEIDLDSVVDLAYQNDLEIYLYKTTDEANNTSTEERKVYVKNKEAGSRVIYLTFDDGPGAYTNQLLDILKKYNVKVTFFVTGKGDDSIIKREYDEGHTVALHTNTHKYNYIYSSQENYFEDLYAIRNRVKRITGIESNIIRFPGGTSNTVSKISMRELAKEVTNRGFYYFDWNVSSGDAGGTTTSDGVYNNVISNLKSGSSVVLQHDIKKFSVDAVERIIQYGLDNGYTFKALDETSPVVHHGANK